jgi:mediator of RNA polymerase II transcription subunit 8
MVAHPLPTYPAQTQEVLLQELLRKKLQPHVEDWVAEARAVASADSAGVDADSGHAGLREVWEWAGQAANEQARRHVWGGNYTLEEREGGIENVVTGLRRRLKADRADGDDGEGDESGSESDEGDGDELEVVGVRRKSVGGVEFDLRRNNEHMLEVGGAAMPIGDVLRYMMTGKRAKG